MFLYLLLFKLINLFSHISFFSRFNLQIYELFLIRQKISNLCRFFGQLFHLLLYFNDAKFFNL
jgi:hypothetical protein